MMNIHVLLCFDLNVMKIFWQRPRLGYNYVKFMLFLDLIPLIRDD